MTNAREQLERMLGGRIESLHEQSLPGLNPSAEEQVVYFAGNTTSDLGDQMHALIGHVTPPLAKAGGVLATKHTLRLPDGQLFHAIKYRGDLEGWRRQIDEGARALDVALGRIEQSSKFVLSDGRQFELANCVHGRLQTR